MQTTDHCSSVQLLLGCVEYAVDCSRGTVKLSRPGSMIGGTLTWTRCTCFTSSGLLSAKSANLHAIPLTDERETSGPCLVPVDIPCPTELEVVNHILKQHRSRYFQHLHKRFGQRLPSRILQEAYPVRNKSHALQILRCHWVKEIYSSVAKMTHNRSQELVR